MKHLNTLFSTLVLLCMSSTVWADLATYLPRGCYHAGQYEQQKHLAGVAKPLITQGSFAFNCHQGLIWHTQSPIIETIVYKTQGDHFILRADNNAQVLDSRVHRALGKILNNLIGGNSDYLQQTFTILEQPDGLVLTPKNKQMQKFLHSLNVTQKKDAIDITMELAEQEITEIHIFSRRSFEALDQSQCAELSGISPAACNILFRGIK
ncbi:MAG: hypothetical protein EOO68_24310 [Moraxellaceae bacterium]|nr:MAG: hypothetical protein EOO68_24310 [Moraxellaceae bacterium]